VFFKIDADVSDEQKEEMVRMGQKYSPVYTSILHEIEKNN
jgi:uncharacterized OsmC-like protein